MGLFRIEQENSVDRIKSEWQPCLTITVSVVEWWSEGQDAVHWHFQLFISLSHLWYVLFWDTMLCTVAPHFHGSGCFCQYQQSMSKAHRHREKVIWLRNIAAMILLFHMGLSLVRAVVGWTIVNSTTGFDPLSEIIEPKYLNFVTLSNSSIWPWSLYNTCIINFHALELQDVMCININCYCCFLLSDFVI